MKSSFRFATLGLIAALVAACSANHHSIFRLRKFDDDSAQVVAVDAKQRSILTSSVQPSSTAPRANDDAGKQASIAAERRRFCAEPSPDVFSIIAQALSAGGSFGQGGDPTSVEAALNVAFSSAEQGATIPRTQTINMLRELMYRTCERYLSGGYDELELSVQAIRDQRLMVSILAIEQLTGAVVPRPVLIGAAGSGGAGASGESIIRLDEARKARDRASASYALATTAYERVNGDLKVCDAIKDKPEGELSDEQKAKVKPCNDVRAERDAALADRTNKTAAYEELSSLARAGGVTVATSLASSAVGGLDVAKSNAVSDVIKTVKSIVKRNFSDSTEVLLFCLRMLRGGLTLDGKTGVSPTQQSDLNSVCVSYLAQLVSTAERRLAAEFARSANIEHATSASNFARFWTVQRQATFAQDSKRAAFVEQLRARLTTEDKYLADCFLNARIQQEVEICFVGLTPTQQRELVEND